ncbi:hypothetical protein CYLTODRAFT_340473 [Cylindrobasidium torrendii FP15055 ss-10]|uniref:Uncharacterized protein n=1 Tax=Cylindrobasidium torrendii FP15055 ss-10 TaxID=1314674 RepID=A0A0D7BVL5_9AGAR|nr:hypothetical protein CYLTODRAFT_340473 [Cylindrobasidium torrendii FP15055 ss-10]
MFSAALLTAAAIGAVSAQSSSFSEGVIATGTMGVTNPPEATLGTDVNQTSYARLISINDVDDWCIFAPPEAGVTIGDSEAYEVAWCTKARNNARVIPDGTITGVSLIKTDFYVQLMAYGDFTKLNLQQGDYGGELDPHGASGDGNPVGGNVTTNIATGDDLHFEEWMSFISYSQVCFRICTNANETWSSGVMCEHKLDEMGCEFVMPGNYNFNGTFESCEAEVAYPPGVYVTAIDGTSTGYSTFAQYYTGVYTADGQPVSYTVGTTVTPTAPQMTPSSSNCKTTATISNGLSLDGAAAATATSTDSGSSSSGMHL